MGFEPTTLRDLVGCSNHLKSAKILNSQFWKAKILKSSNLEFSILES